MSGSRSAWKVNSSISSITRTLLCQLRWPEFLDSPAHRRASAHSSPQPLHPQGCWAWVWEAITRLVWSHFSCDWSSEQGPRVLNPNRQFDGDRCVLIRWVEVKNIIDLG